MQAPVLILMLRWLRCGLRHLFGNFVTVYARAAGPTLYSTCLMWVTTGEGWIEAQALR